VINILSFRTEKARRVSHPISLNQIVFGENSPILKKPEKDFDLVRDFGFPLMFKVGTNIFRGQMIIN